MSKNSMRKEAAAAAKIVIADVEAIRSAFHQVSPGSVRQMDSTLANVTPRLNEIQAKLPFLRREFLKGDALLGTVEALDVLSASLEYLPERFGEFDAQYGAAAREQRGILQPRAM